MFWRYANSRITIRQLDIWYADWSGIGRYLDLCYISKFYMLSQSIFSIRYVDAHLF